MKLKLLVFLAMILAACSPLRQNTPDVSVSNINSPADLPILGEAPELNNQVWINTEQPLHLANLRGQVVLLEMWTFG